MHDHNTHIATEQLAHSKLIYHIQYDYQLYEYYIKYVWYRDQ